MDTSEDSIETHRRKLESITRGDAAPLEARRIIRAALQADTAATSEYVYAALRGVIFEALTSHSFTNLAEWHDLCLATKGLLRSRGCDTVAARLSVLSDLAGQAYRFADVHPIEELVARPHSQSVLQALEAENKPLSHDELCEKLLYGRQNLACICSVLAIAGLVQRQFVDGRQQVILTAAGRSHVKSRESSPTA
jgi:hypothetical protein